jgi:hypothetical protein
MIRKRIIHTWQWLVVVTVAVEGTDIGSGEGIGGGKGGGEGGGNGNWWQG